tara:strand:+ start:153 stop:1028 length:876 start_codon:yes stop_codon:yes gene_type:complete
MKRNNYFYIASYPKSGNTWVRIFIKYLLLYEGKSEDKYEYIKNNFRLNRDLNTGDILSSRDWIDDNLGIDSSDLDINEISLIRSKIGPQRLIFSDNFSFHKVHDAFCLKNGKQLVCSEKCSGAIYIIRHPFDIVISLSNFFKWNIEKSIHFILDNNAYLASSSKRISSQVPQFLGNWSYHVNSWTNQNKIPLLLIKYENLHNYPITTFTEITKFLGIRDDQKLIKKAVESSSFKNLKSKEIKEEGFYESPKNSISFFYKGKIGLGEEKLTQNQQELLLKGFDDMLKKYYPT